MKRTGAAAAMIERQDLNDQRGADIGAEHDRKRRDQSDQPLRREGTRDQGGCGAALEQGRQGDTRRKRGETVIQGLRQKPSEIGTERAQNSAMDHMQAPQQQRHAAHQVEKNHTSHDRPLFELVSKDHAICK